MQAKVNPTSAPSSSSVLQPLLPLQYMSSTFRSACLLSDTRIHNNTRMEMLLGQPPPVAMSQYLCSVTPHLEPPEEQQEQQDESSGGMKEVNSISKGKECVDE